MIRRNNHMTSEYIGRHQYLVHLDTASHGSFMITLPKAISSAENAKRIVSHLVSTNIRASTLPKFNPEYFTDTRDVRIKLEYLG